MSDASNRGLQVALTLLTERVQSLEEFIATLQQTGVTAPSRTDEVAARRSQARANLTGKRPFNPTPRYCNVRWPDECKQLGCSVVLAQGSSAWYVPTGAEKGLYCDTHAPRHGAPANGVPA